MNTLGFSAASRRVLWAALFFGASSAMAFSPYNGKKFKDARFNATGGLFFGEKKATGEVDFKFKSSDPNETTCSFKGKVTVDDRQRRFNGKLKFTADGKVQIDGLPGQGNEKIEGTYTIEGTTVNFEGSKRVTVKGFGEVKVKIEGKMTISGKGEVHIKGTVDAGPISGKFDMNSAKDPPEEKKD